jgi:hypothetical protein
MRNKIPRISNKEVISVFSMGVADIKMKEKLSMNDELTSISQALQDRRQVRQSQGGEALEHNLPEAPPPKSKSKDPKRKEATILTTEPGHK